MRFLGNIEAKADSKGRVFLPAVFRKEIQQAEEVRLVMRKDVFEDCLVLFPESVWNQRLDELRLRLSEWNAVHQRIYRQYVSGVEIVTLDASGRFLIPKRYMQMAAIQQDVLTEYPTLMRPILLRNSRSYFLDYPYLLIFPAAIVSLITITFYLVGNAFSDACDPRNHV